MRKFAPLFLFFVLFLLCNPVVFAATHPNLVVNQADISQIRVSIQSTAAVQHAYEAMRTQTWINGAPAWAINEGWSRQLVEQSFVGLVDNDSQAINQAKANFLIHTQGVDVYHFSKFNGEAQKYQYGQPCTALVLGYDLLEPHLSALEKSNAQAFLIEWGTGLYQYYSGDPTLVSHNFHTSSIACLGLIGLALDGEVNSASTWSNYATTAFRNHYVNYAFNLGGDYTEGYVYQQYGLSAAVLYLDALRRSKGIDLVAQSNMANLWNFYLSAFGSNDSFPRYGDNSGGPFLSGTDLYLLDRSQQQGLKSEYIWLWYRLRGSLAAQNLKPFLFKDFDHLGMVLYFPDVISKTPTSQAFPPSQLLQSVTAGTTQGVTENPGGMVVLRSDWNTSQFSTSLWLNNRWRWQNHQHYDPNSFTLEGYGETLISNLNNRSYDDPLRGKWSQQNTVRIDPSLPNSDAPISPFATGLASSLGTFTRFFRSDYADVVVSDSRYSHANLHTFGLPNGNFSLATTTNIVPIEKAFRTVLLVRHLLPMPFYLLYDDFKKTGATEYWWQVYMPNTATQISGQGTLAQPYTYTVGSAIMRMSFLNFPQVQLLRGPQDPSRGDRPLQLQIQNSELKLLSLLFPSRASDPAPQFTQIQASPVVYEISLEGQTAQVLFNPSRSSVVYQDVETDAQIAVGKDWTLSSRQLVFHQATYARFGGVDFFRTAQPSTQTVPGAYNHCAKSADFNGDGATSLPDFTLLLPRLGEVVSSINEKFDLQCDNAIDLKDLSQLFFRWSF